jgi:uncharacterized protein YecE (DUF72 family)
LLRPLGGELLPRGHEAGGEGFVFSVKAPRLITHVKKLRGCRENLLLFLHLIKPLKESGKLGAILFQTPPSFARDLAALEEVVAALAGKQADIASVSERGTDPFDECVAAFKYFRMHGLGERYASNYFERDLEVLAGKLLGAWDGGKREVFAYFNNDFGGYALANAARLRELVSVA